MEKIKEQLQELIGLVYELNSPDKKYDWFLSFSGHVETVSVHYSKKKGSVCECCGNAVNRDSVYITYGRGYNGLTSLIKEVRKFLD